MKTPIAVGLMVAGCALVAAPTHVRAQAPQKEICFIAAYIDYGDIKKFDPVKGAPLPTSRELVFDDPSRSQRCCADLVGTPPGEKIRLTCNDQLNSKPSSPITIMGFDCQIFRGRRGGDSGFEVTKNTTFSVDGQGRVTMRCTAG